MWLEHQWMTRLCLRSCFPLLLFFLFWLLFLQYVLYLFVKVGVYSYVHLFLFISVSLCLYYVIFRRKMCFGLLHPVYHVWLQKRWGWSTAIFMSRSQCWDWRLVQLKYLAFISGIFSCVFIFFNFLFQRWKIETKNTHIFFSCIFAGNSWCTLDVISSESITFL